MYAWVKHKNWVFSRFHHQKFSIFTNFNRHMHRFDYCNSLYHRYFFCSKPGFPDSVQDVSKYGMKGFSPIKVVQKWPQPPKNAYFATLKLCPCPANDLSNHHGLWSKAFSEWQCPNLLPLKWHSMLRVLLRMKLSINFLCFSKYCTYRKYGISGHGCY